MSIQLLIFLIFMLIAISNFFICSGYYMESKRLSKQIKIKNKIIEKSAELETIRSRNIQTVIDQLYKNNSNWNLCHKQYIINKLLESLTKPTKETQC